MFNKNYVSIQNSKGNLIVELKTVNNVEIEQTISL